MEDKRRDYPWRRGRRRLLLAAFGFLGMAILMFVAMNLRGERAVQNQVAAVRERGEPVTPQELEQRFNNAADGRNSSGRSGTRPFKMEHLYAGPLDALKRAEEFGFSTKRLREGDLLQWMRHCVEDNAEALRLLHESADGLDVRYIPDFSHGWNRIGNPDFNRIRASIDLLLLEALVAAVDGDPEKSARAVCAGLAVGNAFRDAPVFSIQWMRPWLFEATLSGIRHALGMAAFSEAQLSGMQHAVAATGDGESLTKALLGYRSQALGAFDHPEGFVSPDAAARWWLGGRSVAAGYVRAAMALNGDRSRFLSVMDEAIAAGRHPARDALPALEQLDQRVRGDRSWLPSFPFGQMMSSFVSLAEALTANEAHIRCVAAALAIERFRLAEGCVPDELRELMPAYLDTVPENPFDGKPLRVVRDGNSYSVHCVGTDQNDDHGGKIGGRGFIFRVEHLP